MGLQNPEELLIKAELVRQISKIIAARKITQTKAAQILGIDQPKVSALLSGKLSGFSTERLLRFLNLLGNDVEIRVKMKPTSDSQAQTRVIALGTRIYRISKEKKPVENSKAQVEKS